MLKNFLSRFFLNPVARGEGPLMQANPPAVSSMSEPSHQLPMLAYIEVDFSPDRAVLGTLRCISSDGDVMAGPWETSGYADERLAVSKNNPDRNPLLPGGHAPTGTYYVEEVLPARTDHLGISVFGRYKVIRLVPISGDAAMADANGRTSCLICGGDADAPSDGSIRVSDEAMASILHLLAVPLAAERRVVVEVKESNDLNGVLPLYIQNQSWYDDNGYGYTAFDLWDIYWQMYLWDNLTQPTQGLPDDTCVTDPYGNIVCPDYPTSLQDVHQATYTTTPGNPETAQQDTAAAVAMAGIAVMDYTASDNTQWQADSGSAYGR